MPEYENNTEDLKQIIDISKGVIGQLKHFSANYEINRDIINIERPKGMTDNEAEVYIVQLTTAIEVYTEMLHLSKEPFISWIKINESGKDKIVLVTRGYTPSEYQPLNYPDVIYANKLSPYASKILSKKIDEEFAYKGKSAKVLYRDRYFVPLLIPDTDGIQNIIDLTTGTFTVESLCKILDYEDIDLPEELANAIRNLINESEIKKGLRRRIIENIQLRDQPILDEYQIKVYRMPLISNLIISGSAGTGKTTVLINRISLATKPDNLSDEEKAGISMSGLKLLNEQKENWVLFTPTNLLKMYLQQAFNKENIPAYDRTIKTWHDERIELGRNVLKILKINEQGIFTRTQKSLFTIDVSEKLDQFLKEFQNHYLESLKEKFYNAIKIIQELDDKSSLSRSFNNIKSYYESLTKSDLDEKIILLINRLNQLREEYVKSKNASDIKLDNMINKFIRDKNDIIEVISQMIKESKIDEEIEEDAAADNTEDFEDFDIIDNIEITKEEKARAYQYLRRTIAQYSEKRTRGQNISSKSLSFDIISLIHQTLEKNNDDILQIGRERIILKTINQLTSGYIRNLVQLIPNYYLKYRNEVLLDELQNKFDSLLVKDIKDKRWISEQEIDILIYLMLMNTNRYFGSKPGELTASTKNDYLENIKSMYKNIVTVDEATDFTSIALGCIYYLCNPLIRSYTLTGDLMQRVTLDGLKKWDECNLFLTDYKLMPLTCVYRQSNKLLKLAWELYNHFVGEPPFESAFENDDNDPDPIIYKRNDDTKFKQWLTKRILEIYKITDGRATIALFVSEDSEIDPLYDIINESLNNENLEVSRCKGGEILGTNSKIRIYSVEFIKGLEFEAVFFIDLDEIYLRKPALVDKYLYVGLTRAGSFLGVTYKNKFPGPLDFIKSYFSEGDWSWLAK